MCTSLIRVINVSVLMNNLGHEIYQGKVNESRLRGVWTLCGHSS